MEGDGVNMELHEFYTAPKFFLKYDTKSVSYSEVDEFVTWNTETELCSSFEEATAKVMVIANQDIGYPVHNGKCLKAEARNVEIYKVVEGWR